MVTNRNRKSFGSRWKNSKICSDDWHRWYFSSTPRHFETHFVESFRTSKSLWMVDPTCSCEMPRCSAIDAAEIWRSSKMSPWIWSIISGVVTVMGRPGRGASQVEKSNHHVYTGPPSFWWWHSMVHVPLIFLSEWHAFSLAPSLAGGVGRLDDSSCLHVVEIACVAWHPSFQPL